jgi:coenzyme F420-reducing hydrogenase beta subunit
MNVNKYLLGGGKNECCGCSACQQVCPRKCITLSEDEDGFVYPSVDNTSCVECGLCAQVCPYTHSFDPRKPITVYASMHTDEGIRLNSSSGGVFTALAEYVINKGGVIFGAMFSDKWEVTHGYVDSLDDLYRLRGSKYVQSSMDNTYKEIGQFLKQGVSVLFSGTSCQILGLKNYLGKDWKNLLWTVEVVCHGVPSPLVWRNYLTTVDSLNLGIESISFRDKKVGWANFHLSIRSNGGIGLLSQSCSTNSYLKAFLHNLTLRPSCFYCPAKGGRSGADIAIADFWGIDGVRPDLNDDKGISAVLCYSQEGNALVKLLPLNNYETTYANVFKMNRSVECSYNKPKLYDEFWKCYHSEGLDCLDGILKRMQPSLFSRIMNFVIRRIHHIKVKMTILTNRKNN